MKILAICPTIYPKKFEKMYNSFQVTSSRYTNLLTVSERGSITKLINKLFAKNNDYDFYMLLNDDVLFNTPLWDMKLAIKGKISYGNDLLQGKNLCTFPMIDGDIARAVGWLQMPTLEKFCGDVIWKFIGEQLSILNYVPEVIIEHKWEGCPDLAINEKDMEAFANWLPVAFKDIEKVKAVL